jgi:hypothetical protein
MTLRQHVLRIVGIAALSAGPLFAAAPAQADWNSGPNAGMLTGNQTSAVVQAPTSTCGQALGLLGFAAAGCAGGAWTSTGSGDTNADSPSAAARTWSRSVVRVSSRTWS